MSLLDTYTEVSETNTNLLVGWVKGTYTKKEVLSSFKFIKDVTKPGAWKVIQLREEGVQGLQEQVDHYRFLPPVALVEYLREKISGLAAPYDRKAFQEALQK